MNCAQNRTNQPEFKTVSFIGQIQPTDEDEFLNHIEPEIKRRHNLVMPAIYIEVSENEYELHTKDLEDFFSSFGEVKFSSINERHFYILFKFYFSAILCYNTIKQIIKTKNYKIGIKLLENEKEEPKSKDFTLLDISDIIIPRKCSYQFPRDNSEGMYAAAPNDKTRIGNASKICPLAFSQTSEEEKLSKLDLDYDNNANVKLNIDSQPYQSKQKHNIHLTQSTNFVKYIAIFLVQIENESLFKVCKRIIGTKGITMKNILNCYPAEHKLKIRLRGKGSGYLEPITKIESSDPLQLCVSSADYFTLHSVCIRLSSLLMNIYQDYHKFLAQFNDKYDYNQAPSSIMMTHYIISRPLLKETMEEAKSN